MTLSDTINRMIETVLENIEITSASPTATNTVKQINQVENPDLESEIQDVVSKSQTGSTKKQDDINKKVELFDRGNVGDISRFTSQQMGNLVNFVSNPVDFMIHTVLGKFAKGLGVVALATAIFGAVKLVIDEILKPGRLLDIRFKRDIKDEIIAFRRREDQQRLKQGFANIIITTQPRLRGGQNQVTNTFDLVRTGNFPSNIGTSPIMLEASGMPLSKTKGRRNFGGPGR